MPGLRSSSSSCFLPWRPSVFMFFSEFSDKIYTDTNDLGLALDTGIAVVPGGLPVMYASSLKPSVRSVYDVYFDGDGLYLATGQGRQMGIQPSCGRFHGAY